MARTTDNQDEIFDVVDEQDRVIGQATRRECHGNPALIHRAVDVVLFDRSGRMLLQKRSPTKDLYPGFWSVASAGHVHAGGNYEAAAVRELLEELGVSGVSLKPLAKRLLRNQTESEFITVFAGLYDGPLFPNPDEVVATQYFSLPELQSALATKTIQITTSSMIAVTLWQQGQLHV
jgi:isopentenyl-diphosphate delta-isomerase type 1